MIFTKALQTPYPLLVVPLKASWKLAVGFWTEVRPPRTTRPVMPTLLFLVSTCVSPTRRLNDDLQGKSYNLDDSNAIGEQEASPGVKGEH